MGQLSRATTTPDLHLMHEPRVEELQRQLVEKGAATRPYRVVTIEPNLGLQARVATPAVEALSGRYLNVRPVEDAQRIFRLIAAEDGRV